MSNIVVSPHYLSTNAGIEILQNGGNAIDAAIGTNIVQGVVAPETCGIGGDLFSLIWINGENTPYCLDSSGYAGSNVDISQVELVEIIDNEEHVVIEFFSPNCMGCVLSQSAVNEFIDNYSNKFKVIKLNASDNRYSNIISENMITVTPTFIYYKNGKIYEKYVGMLNDSEKLYKKFNQ